MPYNNDLANRIRHRLADLPNIEEKEMMGGLLIMYNGKMCIGIIKEEMMCRIDPNLHGQAVEKYGCRTMDFTKKPMKGYILIEEEGMQSNKDFDYWIEFALNFNARAKTSKKKQ